MVADRDCRLSLAQDSSKQEIARSSAYRDNAIVCVRVGGEDYRHSHPFLSADIDTDYMTTDMAYTQLHPSSNIPHHRPPPELPPRRRHGEHFQVRKERVVRISKLHIGPICIIN